VDPLKLAAQLLTPHMAEGRRDTWLTLAFHGEHPKVYDSIPQRGATADFVVVCVRTLLDRGCLGSRHALSLLLETVRDAAGDERQAEFQALIEGLDQRCAKATARSSNVALPVRDLVYISYRHRDREWHTQLRQVLDADARLRKLIWDDTKIPSGSDFQRQIDDHVARARIMIMLASDDYFGPKCGAAECEIKPALEAQRKGEMLILWLPVRPMSIASSPVAHLMAASGAGAAPLATRSPEARDAALVKVYHAVLHHLGMAPLAAVQQKPAAASPAVSCPSEATTMSRIKREPSMPISRLPDTEARRGLQKIAGCEDPQRAMDVVFVHGLGGDSWTTWMADDDDIGSFWPNWLAGDVAGLGIWTLGYAASGSKWKEESMPLADRGNQVLDLLSIEGLGQRPLAFISHSMGGIVVKQLLRNADSFGVKRYEAILAQTRGIAFIATPHSGAHIANFAELAAAIYRTNEHVGELSAHDPRLRELHGWFLNKYLQTHPLVCRSYCEKRELRPEIPLLRIKLPKGILVVDETSAEPNILGERAIPLDEDHLSICKPADRTAQIYKGMLGFVKDCLAAPDPN
jgi:hypothetical protein